MGGDRVHGLPDWLCSCAQRVVAAPVGFDYDTDTGLVQLMVAPCVQGVLGVTDIEPPSGTAAPSTPPSDGQSHSSGRAHLCLRRLWRLGIGCGTCSWTHPPLIGACAYQYVWSAPDPQAAITAEELSAVMYSASREAMTASGHNGKPRESVLINSTVSCVTVLVDRLKTRRWTV